MKVISNDEDLIKKILSGDRSMINNAFKSLYAANYARVKRQIKANSGTNEDAADVFQDSLLVLYANIRDGKFELKSSISSYLYGIAKNIWLKTLRKKRFNVNDLIRETEFSSIDDSIVYDNLLSVKVLLERIGEGCKSIMIDFYFKKLKMLELAKIYNLGSEEAARNKKYRCLKKLITLIEKNKLDRSDFSND